VPRTGRVPITDALWVLLDMLFSSLEVSNSLVESLRLLLLLLLLPAVPHTVGVWLRTYSTMHMDFNVAVYITFHYFLYQRQLFQSRI